MRADFVQFCPGTLLRWNNNSVLKGGMDDDPVLRAAEDAANRAFVC